MEMLTGFETANKYKIKNSYGQVHSMLHGHVLCCAMDCCNASEGASPSRSCLRRDFGPLRVAVPRPVACCMLAVACWLLHAACCYALQDIMFAAETSGCCVRQCLGSTRPFKMDIVLLNGAKVRHSSSRD